MKLGIVGTRTFDDFPKFVSNVDLFYKSEIHTGDAKGTDAMAREYAMVNEIPLTVHYADWDRYNRGAGPIRNIQLINSVDMILAFWDNKSPGTKQVIEYCFKHHKPFMVVSIKSKDAQCILKKI